MEHLYLNDEFVYVRLQGIVWHTNALRRKSKLLDSSNNILINIIDNVNPLKKLVINCKRINDIGQNLIGLLSSNNRFNKRKIIFIETAGIHEALLSSLKELDISKFDSSHYHIVSPTNSTNMSLEEYKDCIRKVNELEEKVIKRIIIDSYYKFEEGYRVLPSTAILAKGEFNACSIISSPKNFLWTSLYLADKVEEFIQKEIKPQKKLRLLGVSLRGAIFTSSIALLLGYDFDTVDHLGPKHKLYDVDFFENKINKYQYLYIGDYIIGGTEVKIAKTYAQIYGNRLEHAFVIGSLFKPERFSTFKLGYLVNILDIIPKENIDYKLYLDNEI